MSKRATLYINPWGAILPGNYTRAAIILTQELEQIQCFISFVCASSSVVRKNYTQFRNECIQYITSLPNPFSANMTKVIGSGKDAILFDDRVHEKMISQMIYSRMVDSFLRYLKDLLAETIAARPQILKSSETEKLDFILSFDDLAELRAAIAERKIERLFYGGFGDIAEFYARKIGIELFDSPEALQRVILMTRLRNLIVHNAGIINGSFKKEYPDYAFAVDDRLEFTFGNIFEEISFLVDISVAIDKKVSAKFGLITMEKLWNRPKS